VPETIPLAAWEPDKSDRQNPTAEAKGVCSYAGQYAPFPDLTDYGAASDIDSTTKLLLPMDGADGATAFPDISPTAHAFTAAGNAQVDTAQSKFGGASLLLDGTGDWITASDHADFALGSSGFRIDCWVRPAADGAVERIAGQGASGLAATDTAWYIEKQADNTIHAFVSTGSAFVELASAATVLAGDFTNIRLTRVANVIYLFVAGNMEDSDAFTGSVFNATDDLRIGAAGEDTTDPFAGWIDEFSIWVGGTYETDDYTPRTTPWSFGAGAEDVVLGARTVYDEATLPAIFYGDASRLYRLTDRIATIVSKPAGYSLGTTNTWQGAQFGNNVVFVSGTENPQHYELGASVVFADLAGSPPANATSIARVNDFLMMGKGFTVHWSAFNDVADWVPDTATQAGNQELDQEQGEIMSILGLDFAAIFQERAVRRAIYVGPPVIWDFGQDYVEKARGCISRNAAAAFGRLIFYAADDGFYVFDGQSSAPIGYGKVDDYFTRRLNYSFRHKVAVGIDGQRKLAVFGFPAGSSQFISELLIYSISDGRWTHDEIDLEHLYDSPAEPLTLESISAVWGDDIDASTVTDIDSDTFNDRRRRLAAFTTSDHRLAMFTGQPRAATMDTAEIEVAPGRRAMVTEIWPVGDMGQAAVSASIGYRRALPGATVAFTSATAMNRAGFCPQRLDARFMRGRLQVAAGASWRRMEGMHVTATPTGMR
jgi:hypothetical protein